MEKFKAYKPMSLLELSAMEIDSLTPEEQQELIELVLLESKNVVEALSLEVDNMDEKVFSLDSFYEIQAVIKEYKHLMAELEIDNKIFKEYLDDLLNRLERKNPLSKMADQNDGVVLIHTSRFEDAKELLSLKEVEASEICTTGGTLKKYGDIFRSKVRETDIGLIFNASDANAFFSRDMGSHYRNGRRVLEPRMLKYKCETLQEALARGAKRVEAWVDTQTSPVRALLMVNESKREEILQLAQEHNLPVVYNTHLYE